MTRDTIFILGILTFATIGLAAIAYAIWKRRREYDRIWDGTDRG